MFWVAALTFTLTPFSQRSAAPPTSSAKKKERNKQKNQILTWYQSLSFRIIFSHLGHFEIMGLFEGISQLHFFHKTKQSKTQQQQQNAIAGPWCDIRPSIGHHSGKLMCNMRGVGYGHCIAQCSTITLSWDNCALCWPELHLCRKTVEAKTLKLNEADDFLPVCNHYYCCYYYYIYCTFIFFCWESQKEGISLHSVAVLGQDLCWVELFLSVLRDLNCILPFHYQMSVLNSV